jgi:hypothetical protein
VPDAAVVTHSISIALPDEAADRLRELARRERRSPRQQAAVLVLAGLDHEGVESSPQPRHRITWTAGRDGQAHAAIAGRPRTPCGLHPVAPPFAWPETRPRCAVCLAAEEVMRAKR